MRQRDQIFQKKCKKTKARDKMIDIYDKENFTFLAIIYEPPLWLCIMQRKLTGEKR